MLEVNITSPITFNLIAPIFEPDNPFAGIFTFDNTAVKFDTTQRDWSEV